MVIMLLPNLPGKIPPFAVFTTAEDGTKFVSFVHNPPTKESQEKLRKAINKFVLPLHKIVIGQIAQNIQDGVN